MLNGKGVLALAMVLGTATSFGVWYYVENATAQARPIRLTRVVTAARYIPARTVLLEEHLQVVEVPQEARLADAVPGLAAALGKVTKIALTPNEQVIVPKLFAERKESGLAFVVPPSKRAVSVGVSEVIGSGGLIVPGDHVDVIGLFELKSQNSDPLPMATTLLQNVEVLAVAQQLEGDDQKGNSSRLGRSVGTAAGLDKASGALDSSGFAKTEPAAQPLAKTVTLAVSPAEAQRLALGEQFGHVRLTLRPYGDTSVVEVGQATIPGFTPAAAAVAAPAPALPPPVSPPGGAPPPGR